jgi:DNA-binding Lrp family transcriptional regulator
MADNTLDERDRAILERLHRGAAGVDALAGPANASAETLGERLPALADNGLVERVGDGEYALTDDGARVVAASPAGAMDNRIDTPDDVEAALAAYDLRPDREGAVRDAFAFLHYWGEATKAEIVDAVFSENPAEYDDGAAWWSGLVRDHLAALPAVGPPEPGSDEWRYTRTPVVAMSGEDGRDRLGPAADRSSAKFALEQLPVEDDEREAVRAAFELLAEAGAASADELRERVYPDHDAGYDSADAWWAAVRESLPAVPGVEQAESEGDAWEHRETDDGGE